MLFRTVTLVFNLRRLQAKPKVQTDVLDELLYADDMDRNAQRQKLAQSQKCKEPWIKSHSHVITMLSQSAQKDRLYTNQHLENSTMNQPSL